MKRTILSEYLDILDYKSMPEFLKKYLTVPSLVRLKNIGYLCGMDYASKDIYDFPEKISRYDHSLTVALLTWKCTKNRIKTLAALFHDISTPCFSHVIDYMNNDYEEQESTEKMTEEIIKNDIVLRKYLKEDNIIVEDIIDFKKYSIVDLDRPKLCADRLDGIILTSLYWTKTLDISDVKNILKDMAVVKNEFGEDEITFRTTEVAKLVLQANDIINDFCHTKEDNYMMELLANITRIALDYNIINYNSLFYLDEEELHYLLENCKNIKILEELYRFKNIKKDEIPNLELPFVKVRTLNPLVHNKRLK